MVTPSTGVRHRSRKMLNMAWFAATFTYPAVTEGNPLILKGLGIFLPQIAVAIPRNLHDCVRSTLLTQLKRSLTGKSSVRSTHPHRSATKRYVKWVGFLSRNRTGVEKSTGGDVSLGSLNFPYPIDGRAWTLCPSGRHGVS